jgi:hypothetical protein
LLASMELIGVHAGDKLVAEDAFGNVFETRAVSDVEIEGHNFPVVWIERPLKDGTTERVPWPADAVRPA